MRIISCDPGASGALSWFEDGVLINSFNMPKINKRLKNGNKDNRKPEIDTVALAEIFTRVEPEVVIIEKVHSMPRQGVSSTFKFGYSFGLLVGMANMITENVVMVSPQEWKKTFDLIGTEKSEATQLAKIYNKSIKNSGQADSYLIGLWYIQTQGKEDE